MTVWWITLATSFLLCMIARSTGMMIYQDGQYREKYNKFFSFIAASVLIFVAGVRADIGDTTTYKYSFKNLPHSFGAYLSTLKLKGDWGFDFLSMIIKTKIKDSPEVFIFIVSLITVGCIFIAFYKYTELLELSIFLFITTGCYLVSMNGVRQYLASSILFLAFPLIYKRKWQIYFPLVLICSTFHKSALLFIPLYFVVDSPAWGNTTKWILFVGVFLFISYPITGPILANILGETQYGNYKNALMSTGAGANMIRVIVMAVPVVFSYIGRDFVKGKEKYYNIVVNFSVINLIAILLATKFWIYARFNMYFSLYMIILLTWIVRYMFSGKNRKIMYLICIILYLLYYYYEMHISLGYGPGYQHFIQSVGINL